MQNTYKLEAAGTYSLKNVRLETGFKTLESGDVVTITDLFCVEVKDGEITGISANDPNLSGAMDAQGLLMLPAIKDMHIHLDKTLYGLPWQALAESRKTVANRIAYEIEIIPELLKTAKERSDQLINLLQSYGTSFARAHVNIESTSKLESLGKLESVLQRKKESFSSELVAFPQHGLYYTDALEWMQRAVKLDSIAFVGALDPYSIDGHIEKSLDATLQMAIDTDKGIDMHLHDGGEQGIKTIEYLIHKVLENPQLKGKTYISHAFFLAELSPAQAKEFAGKLANAKIGIVSSVPIRDKMVMPIPILMDQGVEVLIGSDNIQDHWSTLGSGNMLQKVNLMADLYGWETELSLSRAFGFATKNLLPLASDGAQNWPKKGDPAEFTFIDASCSAEAVARVSKTVAFAHKGNLYWKQAAE